MKCPKSKWSKVFVLCVLRLWLCFLPNVDLPVPLHPPININFGRSSDRGDDKNALELNRALNPSTGCWVVMMVKNRRKKRPPNNKDVQRRQHACFDAKGMILLLDPGCCEYLLSFPFHRPLQDISLLPSLLFLVFSNHFLFSHPHFCINSTNTAEGKMVGIGTGIVPSFLTIPMNQKKKGAKFEEVMRHLTTHSTQSGGGKGQLKSRIHEN